MKLFGGSGKPLLLLFLHFPFHPLLMLLLQQLMQSS